MNQGTTVEELDAPQYLRHQQREWITERAGWCIMVTILTVAALGGLGPGALGQREFANADKSVRVRAYRFERSQAPTVIEIWIQPSPGSKATELSLSREFADDTLMEQIVPEPDRMAIRNGQMRLSFTGSDLLAQGGKIVYRFKHDGYGPLVFDISLADGEPVKVRQFVLP